MNARVCLFAMLMCPALAPAQQPPEPPAKPTAAAASSASSATGPAKLSFSLTDPGVQRVLRDAAISTETASPSPASPLDDAPPRAGLPDLRFRAARRVHHLECDTADVCEAYDAEGNLLYTVTRDAEFRSGSWSSNDTYDSWLACQSTNNLLTTFERYDKCRGINIGLPAASRNLTIALPRIERK